MGKGTRNRLDRADTVAEPKKAAPRAKKTRKPFGKTAKIATACVLAVLIVAGIVVGALWSNGAFRSRTPLVESKNGSYNLTKASAAYLLWESQINYMVSLYQQWGILTSSNAISYYGNFLSSYRSDFTTPAKLRETLENSADTLTGYIGVCDIAKELGISLTDEEIKTAKENAAASLDTWVNIANNTAMSKLSSGSKVTVDDGKGGTKEVTYSQKYYNKDICSNGSDFLKKYVGSDITKQDVYDAALIAALYNKVLTDKNEKVEESLIKNGVMDADQIAAYRDKNKADYFTTDYLTYVTEDADLKEALENATDATAIKKIIAETVANKVYKALFNKYATGTNAEAEELYNKITSDKTTADTLAGEEFGMTVSTDAKKDDIKEADKVKAWITDSARKAGDKDTIAVTDDGIYVVVLISKGTDSTADKNAIYTYAVKKCALVDATDDFKDDENFKTNIINSILVNLELTEGDEIYKEGDKPDENADEDTKICINAAVSILTDMKAEIDEALTVKNEKYADEKDEDGKDAELEDWQKWMFHSETAVKAGDTFTDTKVEGKDDDQTTTYTIYAIIEPMKLDTEKAIWGGYIKFSSDDQAEKAAEAKAKLEGKTGLELWRALQELAASTSYGFESSDLTSMSDLSKWMLDKDRKANDIAVVTGQEKDSSSSSSSSSDTKIDVTYVAVVIEPSECWKSTAFSNCISDTVTDWIEECRQGYSLNTAILQEMPTVAKTETETATAAAS